MMTKLYLLFGAGMLGWGIASIAAGLIGAPRPPEQRWRRLNRRRR